MGFHSGPVMQYGKVWNWIQVLTGRRLLQNPRGEMLAGLCQGLEGEAGENVESQTIR